MTVAVTICNAALNKLGQEPISSLSDDNKRARNCALRYQDVVDMVLRDHFWNFAIVRDVISASATALAFGDAKAYPLPNDCVRVMKVMYDKYTYPRYKIEGRNIVISNYNEINGVTSPIQLAYISSNASEAHFDSNFKEAVATRLAAELCYSITQSSSMKQGLLAEYKDYLGDGKSINSQEVSPDDINFDYFDNARRTGHEVYPDSNFP